MTTYTLNPAVFPCLAALAERVRQLVANGYRVEVAEEGVITYSVTGFPGVTTDGPVYWLKDARGRTVGTIADVNAMVRYAQALPRPVASVSGRKRA